MTTPFWEQMIRLLPEQKLIDWAVDNRKAIKDLTPHLSPFPDWDPRGSPALRQCIENYQEDLGLVLAELDRRGQPGPRDWSPRGDLGIPKVRIPWE